MIDADAFDHVIAGGGTAGCLLAARLGEDRTVTVRRIPTSRPGLDRPT